MSCNEPTKEISWSWISITQPFSNKDRPLEIEEIHRCKNISKTSIHDQEEYYTFLILNYLVVINSFLIIKSDADYTKEYSLKDFKDQIKRLSHRIHQITFEDSCKLSTPWRLILFLDHLKLMILWLPMINLFIFLVISNQIRYSFLKL